MKGNIIRFLKQETVLCAALMLAACSALFVHPDPGYRSYIDFRTLSILFCLMGAMAGLQKTGVFRWVAQALLCRVKKARQLVLILVLLCFFSSMAITNDVALITFVPFTFIVLSLAGTEIRKRFLIPVIVLQTIAANLGSMLTPVGNPQNLYLFGRAGISLGEFIRLMLPYTLLSLFLLLLWSAVSFREYDAPITVAFDENVHLLGQRIPLAAYFALFGIDLLAVARVIPYGAALVVTIVCLLLIDRSMFARIDYSLLLTFVGFFIFIGNMGRLPVFYEFLRKIVSGNELLAGAAASQVISNVPAALLLSGFTKNLSPLIIGVNIGGLGSLIASMASLISYKLVVREEGEMKGAYFRQFTVTNICFSAALLLFAFV